MCFAFIQQNLTDIEVNLLNDMGKKKVVAWSKLQEKRQIPQSLSWADLCCTEQHSMAHDLPFPDQQGQKKIS